MKRTLKNEIDNLQKAISGLKVASAAVEKLESSDGSISGVDISIAIDSSVEILESMYETIQTVSENE